MTRDWTLPAALSTPDDSAAVAALSAYYFPQPGELVFEGAHFDTWDSTGTRDADRDRFTADDLVAITFLSVRVPPASAIRLLDTDASRFSRLLRALPDRDLVEEREPFPTGWAGARLRDALCELEGIDVTTASKLMARKRPRLRPISDSVVLAQTRSTALWEDLRLALTGNDGLHERLVHLRSAAGLGAEVSAIRVFDVITWMQGTGTAKAAQHSPTSRA